MNPRLEDINHSDSAQRLATVRALGRIQSSNSQSSHQSGFVNNHIHTTFSFSPYSPSAAVWHARQAGLLSAGIMDHDSIAGAPEFIEAGASLGLPITVGVECRADFSKTALAGRLINHPDQHSCAYVALHGIPHPAIPQVQAFFKPLMQAREARNRAMTCKLAGMLSTFGLSLAYDTDVLPFSEQKHGGSVTERHLLFAAAQKILRKTGPGAGLVLFLEQKMQLAIPARVRDLLLDVGNSYVLYDLLGVLKSGLVSAFYLPAREELPLPETVTSFGRSIGAISAYAYLGDVGDSVTGDKRTQKFEDDYLDLLFSEITRLGFQAVTYMPSRNTLPQLLRVQALCRSHELLEISGEDINSPRQSFICQSLLRPEFKHLIDMTWALIGHEASASRNSDEGFFSPCTIQRFPNLSNRIAHFREQGLAQTKSATR